MITTSIFAVIVIFNQFIVIMFTDIYIFIFIDLFTYLLICLLIYLLTYIYIYGHTPPPPHDLPRSVSLVNTVKNPLVPYAIFCYSQWLSLDKTDPTAHKTGRRDARDQKTKKTIFFREWGGDVEKDCFFGFAS